MAVGDDVLVAVEAHLLVAFGVEPVRASIAFLGLDRIDVLRFTTGTGVHYATLGASRLPMGDPTSMHTEQVSGPRAELILTTLGPHDDVLRPLATLAASPAVEGLVLVPGATLRLGQPLWQGALETSVRLAESPLVQSLELGGGRDPVRFFDAEPSIG